MAYHFWLPFHKAYIEKRLIDQAAWVFNSPFSSYSAKNEELDSLYQNPSIELDIRVRDGRIETYVELVIQSHSTYSDGLKVLRQGLLADSVTAFRFFYLNYPEQLLSIDVPSFVKRATDKITQLPKWDHTLNMEHFSILVAYYLDNCIDEPLLLWRKLQEEKVLPRFNIKHTSFNPFAAVEMTRILAHPQRRRRWEHIKSIEKAAHYRFHGISEEQQRELLLISNRY